MVGFGTSEFSVNIVLRQGNPLSPLMFVMLMELVSGKVCLRGGMGRMLYADDLAVVVESGQKMQEVLEEWKEAFGKHGLKMSMEKIEVMCMEMYGGDLGLAAEKINEYQIREKGHQTGNEW